MQEHKELSKDKIKKIFESVILKDEDRLINKVFHMLTNIGNCEVLTNFFESRFSKNNLEGIYAVEVLCDLFIKNKGQSLNLYQLLKYCLSSFILKMQFVETYFLAYMKSPLLKKNKIERDNFEQSVSIGELLTNANHIAVASHKKMLELIGKTEKKIEFVIPTCEHFTFEETKKKLETFINLNPNDLSDEKYDQLKRDLQKEIITGKIVFFDLDEVLLKIMEHLYQNEDKNKHTKCYNIYVIFRVVILYYLEFVTNFFKNYCYDLKKIISKNITENAIRLLNFGIHMYKGQNAIYNLIVIILSNQIDSSQKS